MNIIVSTFPDAQTLLTDDVADAMVRNCLAGENISDMVNDLFALPELSEKKSIICDKITYQDNPFVVTFLIVNGIFHATVMTKKEFEVLKNPRDGQNRVHGHPLDV
jgi:hypothetical protein